MTERATTSASNIFRRALCPASARMEDGLAEEDSEQSVEGSLLHEHSADPTLPLTKLKRHQRDLLETNERLVKEMFRRVEADFGELPALIGGRETEMFLHRGVKSLFPGHCDLWEYDATRKLLIIADFKFGYREVDDASANLQLRAYACMGAEIHDCDNVVCAITQPRLPRDQQLTLAVYSRDDIEAARRQLYAIWDKTKEPDAPLVAGEHQCRYCLAKLICDAYKAKFLAIGEGINRSTVATAQHSLKQLDDDQLERVLIAVQFAGFIEKHAKDIARERIQAGGMPGWKLGKESEVREVTDVPAAVEALVGGGVPANKLRAALKMKVGEVEEAWRDVHGGTWQEAKDAVNTHLNGLIERHKKQPSVERVR